MAESLSSEVSVVAAPASPLPSYELDGAATAGPDKRGREREYLVRKLFETNLPSGTARGPDCSVEETVTDLTSETLRQRHWTSLNYHS